jgi:hypothetical protein
MSSTRPIHAETDRRRHFRRTSGLIIDYQLMQEESGALGKRAASVNVSENGLCIRSPFIEKADDVLLLSIPYITPNPGIFAAKIKYSAKTDFNDYCYGLYVLPLFQERFSVVNAVSMPCEPLTIQFEETELDALKGFSGNETLANPVVEGICKFWSDLNPRITEPIASFEDLTAFLLKEIGKRNNGGR